MVDMLHPFHFTVWFFLFVFVFPQGYLPANVDRRESTLQRKRKEYFAFVEQYYDSRNDENHQDTYRQVKKPTEVNFYLQGIS